MPLDSIFDFKRRCVGWESKRSFLPRKCYYTNKPLWFRKAFRGTAIITGPGDALFEERWVDSKEYIFLKLKGII